MSKAILFIEHAGGELRRASLECLGAALSAGLDVTAVVMGPGADAASEGLSASGASAVCHLTGADTWSPDRAAADLAALVKESGAAAFLAAATATGKDIAPRIAAHLDSTLFSDITTLDASGGSLQTRRPWLAGKVIATCESRMPWLTIVVGRLYGVAGQCQHRPTGMFRRYAWPSARWGSMHIQGGASAAYRREIDSAPDPAAKLEEIERRLEALASPFRTAEATGQDIIDPRETRPLMVEFVEDAQTVLRTQLGPPVVPYRP